MRLARHGAIIPVVILAIVVMAILGTWLMWQSTSNYAQMTRVAWSLRCREMLLAAMEEARALAYDRLNRTMPLPGAPGEAPREPDLRWHAELLVALRRAGAMIPRGVLVSHDLKREGLLPRTSAIASANSSEIVSASAELLGFKRLSVDNAGLFEDGRIYYRAAALDPPGSDAKFTPPMEWIGSLRLRVTVRSGNHTRTLANVLDVKVVDINASAREFVLFSFLSSARGTEHGPTSDEYLRWDLRRGGAMHLHGQGTGRIFVRGPFLVDSVGRTDGTGGPTPPNATTSNWNNEWWGWGIVPATRDGIMERAGPALVNFSMPPMRPDRTRRRRALVGLVTGRFGSAWQEWFNDDAGFYIKDGQRYFCESKSTDQNIFSITGRPGAPALFRGQLAEYPDDRSRQVVDTSARFVRGNSIVRPVGREEDLRYAIEPEGGLNGVYNVVEFEGDSYAFGTYQYYKLTQLSAMQGRLGLHWERKYTTSWLEQFVTDLLRLPAVIGTAGLIPAALLPASIAQKVAVAVLAFVGINARPNVRTELSRIRPDEIANTMPPNYRPPARSVTRRHPRFSTLAGQRDSVPVVLDGIVAFDELVGTRPFKYGGRGVIYSESSSAPSLVVPISPERAGDPRASLVIHHEGPVPRAHEGAAMLNLSPSRGGNTVLASIYATQGAKPQGTVNVIGTLVCGYLNKSRFPNDAALDVHYRPPVTPPGSSPSTSPPVIEPLTAISFRNAFVHDR